MRYPDTVKLATTTPDGYGDQTVTVLDEIEATFIKRSGINHETNTDGEMSDAAVYLIPTNAKVLELEDDLEGMYIIYGDTHWYRIIDVHVARRKLLNNAIDNVYCRLEKVAGMPYVLVS